MPAKARPQPLPRLSRRLCLHVLVLCCFVGTSAKRGAGCGLGYPLHQAGWSDKVPPYVQPEGCSLQVLTRARLQRCLANRTLYIIGNSIARNYQAEVAELVGGASPFTPNVARRVEAWESAVVARITQQQQQQPRRRLRRKGGGGPGLGGPMHVAGSSTSFAPDTSASSSVSSASSPGQRVASLREHLRQRRQDQKVLCGQSCATTCAGGFVVKYARVQYFGGWPRAFPRFGDVCGKRGTGAVCLGPFFRGSRPGDVLVVQMGLMYGITHLLDRAVSRAWPMSRLKERVQADVAGFPAVLAAVWGGRASDVYFATTGPASSGKWAKVNDFVRWFNPMAVAALGPSGAGYKVLDQYGLSAPRAHTGLYNDYVHISGPLTQAALHILLSDVCADDVHERSGSGHHDSGDDG